MDKEQPEFKYEKWQQGIADSPEDGFANITCCNVERYPGAITPGFPTVNTSTTTSWGGGVTVAFSGTITTTVTFTGLPIGVSLYNGEAVVFSGSLPPAITAGTAYYLGNVSGNTATLYPGLGAVLNSGTAVDTSKGFVSYLMVGGGGGGGGGFGIGGGGGGAGGVQSGSGHAVGIQSYSITVGTGGLGGTGGNNINNSGDSGTNSVFDTITANSGGGGGGWSSSGSGNGRDGASGGGGSAATPGTGGTGIAGQGHNGGNGLGGANATAGGGGGAGTAGANGGNISPTGKGGNGVSSSITGSAVTYGGGGGGGVTADGSTGGYHPLGGSGGGGASGISSGGNGQDGTDGLGGGGGGASEFDNSSTFTGGTGGDGIVIISYTTGSITATGGTITTSGGNTIHSFTSSDTFVVSSINHLSGGSAINVTVGTVVDIEVFYGGANTVSPANGIPNVFAVDSAGNVWWQQQTGTTLTSYTQGIWYLILQVGAYDITSYSLTSYTGNDNKPWLFLTFNTTVDVLNTNLLASPTFSASSWNTSFISFSSAYLHKGVTSPTTSSVYWTDANFVVSFFEKTTFDPTDSATYTNTGNALILPKYEQGQCLDILGTNLLVGGRNSSIVYQWDTVSIAYTPLYCGEQNVQQIKTIANVAYILAGVKGIVYYTTGSTVVPLKKIPEYITGGSVLWGGIEKFDGNLIFGFVGTQNNSVGVRLGGVGKLFITEQAYMTSIIPSGSFVIDQLPASGTVIPIYALANYQNNTLTLPTPVETYYIGSSNGIDVVDPTKSRTDGSSFVELSLEKASKLTAVRTMQKLGIELLQPLASTQSIAVLYRSALNASFSSVVSFVSTGNDGSLTFPFSASNIATINLLQLKITLTSATGNSYPVLANLQIQ